MTGGGRPRNCERQQLVLSILGAGYESARAACQAWGPSWGTVRLSAPMYHKLELAREVEEPKVEEPKVEDHELVREVKEQTKNLSE